MQRGTPRFCATVDWDTLAQYFIIHSWRLGPGKPVVERLVDPEFAAKHALLNQPCKLYKVTKGRVDVQHPLVFGECPQ